MFETLCTPEDALPEWEYDRNEQDPPSTPVVGMGVTIYLGSDRYPATVTGIAPNGRRFKCQWDNTQRRDAGGFFYLRNTLSTREYWFSLRKDGVWREVGGGSRFASLGSREYYRCPEY